MSAVSPSPNASPDVDWPPNMRPRVASAYTGLSENHLAKMRCTGDGPAFVRLNRKLIIYRREDIDAWLGAHVFQSTSGYGQGEPA